MQAKDIDQIKTITATEGPEETVIVTIQDDDRWEFLSIKISRFDWDSLVAGVE